MVGHARRQTARPMGPSTRERSKGFPEVVSADVGGASVRLVSARPFRGARGEFIYSRCVAKSMARNMPPSAWAYKWGSLRCVAKSLEPCRDKVTQLSLNVGSVLMNENEVLDAISDLVNIRVEHDDREQLVAA